MLKATNLWVALARLVHPLELHFIGKISCFLLVLLVCMLMLMFVVMVDATGVLGARGEFKG